MALLDMLAREAKQELVVAHFDHGIRPESDADARFVKALAEKYGLIFESTREELSAGASEAEARERRYLFLDSIAKKYSGKIVTAHHQGDVIETIAINLTRGTGWRGLAVLNNSNIVRPLLQKTKQELYDYALTHNLEWVEDETNQTNVYLRNRLRKKLATLPEASRKKLIGLYEKQLRLKQEIEKNTAGFLSVESRHFYTMIPPDCAVELLRAITDRKLTRPQLIQLLLAIKTAPICSIYEAGSGVGVSFSKTEFTLQKFERRQR